MIRWPDLVVMALYFGAFIFIGAFFARRQKSAESYFLAGRNMPGWVVGFSLMATVISSMTFLAGPGFAYAENWRYMPTHLGYLAALVVALLLFMPFFRRSRVSSAYEYLERRFGTWARSYAAAGFVLFQIFRMSVILYAVCLPVQTLFNIPMPWIILVVGIVAASYTIAGGLEAVIWTDFLQGVALILGGLICLPIVVGQLPGGFGQILSEAYDDGKLSVGSTAFDLTERTMWVMILLSLFNFLQIGCVDQMTVQRYCAPRTEREARKAIIVGAVLSIPVWVYFTFIGTALYVFYKANPDPGLDDSVPEQVLPYFIFTQVPAGLAGFVISGLMAAAMSTVDSSINAAASTLTNDFYKRFLGHREARGSDLSVGRWFSIALAVVMIGGAMVIHFTRTQTLADLQTVVMSIISGGLLGLFLLGFLTRRVDNRSALISVVLTVAGVIVWLVLASDLGPRLLPGVEQWLPDTFWIIVFANIFLFVIGYGIAWARAARARRDLGGLTVWTMTPTERSDEMATSLGGK